MNPPLRSLCVFAGSARGARPEYAAAAADLGRLLAQRGMRLVFGGGRVGLMGIAADSALAAGGEVIGVIPTALRTHELAHQGCTELIEVSSMHERKALMAELADGFMALPGGIGTLEEWCEVLTWSQLGLHAKPLGLLNVAGYFDPLLAMLGRAVDERFYHPEHQSLYVVADSARELLALLAQQQLPALPRVIRSVDQT